MSNTEDKKNNVPNKKVISLKNLSEFRERKSQSYKDQIASNQLDIESQITDRKKELLLLEAQKKKMLGDMKTAIHKEKEAWIKTKEIERKEAQNIGYKTGYDAGIEAAEKKYADLIAEVNDMVTLAKEDYFKTIEGHEKAIIKLAIATAEKVTKQYISESENGLLEIIRQGIEALKKRSNIAVYVQPSDYEYVLKRKDELEELLEDGELISIYADEKMNKGDCLIKHPYGELEIGIDVQLKQIKAALEEKVTENQ